MDEILKDRACSDTIDAFELGICRDPYSLSNVVDERVRARLRSIQLSIQGSEGHLDKQL